MQQENKPGLTAGIQETLDTIAGGDPAEVAGKISLEEAFQAYTAVEVPTQRLSAEQQAWAARTALREVVGSSTRNMQR